MAETSRALEPPLGLEERGDVGNSSALFCFGGAPDLLGALCRSKEASGEELLLSVAFELKIPPLGRRFERLNAAEDELKLEYA